MKKGKKLYEGKAKIIYATTDKDLVIQYFKDDATAFNNLKKSKIEGKGVLNNRISEYLLNSLNQCGIQTHLIKRLNMREQLIKEAKVLPIEFVVRNIATGSLTKRLGISEGTVLEGPLLEYYLKNDELEDPLISKEHIYSFEWATEKEIKAIDKVSLRINDILQGIFRGVGIKLVDFKIEYGRVWSNDKEVNEIILADEPTGSLDQSKAKEVFQILYNLKNKNRIIIFATHNRFFANMAACKLEMINGNIKTINARIK